MTDSQAPDPFNSLHKMSTTAGLGSGDYVAINPLSVLAVLLGLCAFLALLGNVFLFISLAGLVCGIAALRQIGRSNGTQTGKPLAWSGLLLSISAAVVVGSMHLTTYLRDRTDKKAIASLIVQLESSLTSKPENAYGLFTDGFHRHVPQDKFTARFQSIITNDSYGPIKSLEWNWLAHFENKTDEPGTRLAVGMIKMHFVKNNEPQWLVIRFAQTGGQWKIDNLPDLFSYDTPGNQ